MRGQNLLLIRVKTKYLGDYKNVHAFFLSNSEVFAFYLYSRIS